jgi:hypothetical protein
MGVLDSGRLRNSVAVIVRDGDWSDMMILGKNFSCSQYSTVLAVLVDARGRWRIVDGLHRQQVGVEDAALDVQLEIQHLQSERIPLRETDPLLADTPFVTRWVSLQPAL